MIAKTVARTIFYQFFLIFIGLSVGFIINSEYIGWKSNLVSKSFKNIFMPIKYDEDVCQKIKNWAAFKIWAGDLNRPNGFEVIEDGLLNEEFYIGKFKYIDEKGKERIVIKNTRVRWKSWEYYYESPEPWSKEEINEYIKNGNLNSKESDKAFKLMHEMKKMENENVF